MTKIASLLASLLACFCGLYAPAIADLSVIQSTSCSGIAAGGTCAFSSAPANGDVVVATTGAQNGTTNFCPGMGVKDSNSVALVQQVCQASVTVSSLVKNSAIWAYSVTGSPTATYTITGTATVSIGLIEIRGAVLPTVTNAVSNTTTCTTTPCTLNVTATFAANRTALIVVNSGNTSGVTATNGFGPAVGTAQTVLSAAGSLVSYAPTQAYFAGGGANLCSTTDPSGATSAQNIVCEIILPSSFGTNGAGGVVGDAIFERLLTGRLMAASS